MVGYQDSSFSTWPWLAWWVRWLILQPWYGTRMDACVMLPMRSFSFLLFEKLPWPLRHRRSPNCRYMGGMLTYMVQYWHKYLLRHTVCQYNGVLLKCVELHRHKCVGTISCQGQVLGRDLTSRDRLQRVPRTWFPAPASMQATPTCIG